MINLATCPESDECLTPRYAVEPIIPFLKDKGFKNIWCPFDKEDSMYTRILKREKMLFYNTHIQENMFGKIDFFHLSGFLVIPEEIDCIVSNPPFSLKDKILKRLFQLDTPFAMLMPITALGGKKRQEMFKEYGIEVLFLGERTGFYTRNDLTQIKEKNHFECCYICHNLLPEKIMYATMNKIQEPYNVEI